ncbi:MAG: hypothetical protein KAV00_08035 [Phycisphaerae bacterium]|nr:hypothetical protein [Phycisphaerae bacterium]
MNSHMVKLFALALVMSLVLASGVSSPPSGSASKPASNLDYWLSQTKPTTTSRPASRPSEVNPFGRTDRFSRSDALPGVVVLSDGKILPGGVFTTRDKDWEVWSALQKRWRHIPPIVVLSIRAVVVEEGMEKEWRWKEMGRNERFYTGRAQPVRRLLWRFHLIDDSYITGAVKGQPLWVESAGKRHGPFVLHERTKGKLDQTLDDLIYVKQVVISRRAMKETLKIQLSASSP